MTRRRNTATHCAVEGCTEPREWDKNRMEYRSRLCVRHRYQRDYDNRVARAAKPPASSPLSPAQVLDEWAHDRTAEVFYCDKRVYGLKDIGGGSYRATLAGATESVVLSAAVVLERRVLPVKERT